MPAAWLPAAGVGHRFTRLRSRERATFLQQLDGDVVRGAHEGHVSIARWPQDGDAVIGEALTGGVDVIHGVGEMAEVTPAGVVFGIPVVGELDLRALIAGSREKHQRVAALRIVPARELSET